ncbi:MAG: ComEC/Rec2 family competence protein [Deltaproteobacteria bacterium]|nr:ComEC/Rec2 family competence protein [Deltaproteobacteria bacterium]
MPAPIAVATLLAAGIAAAQILPAWIGWIAWVAAGGCALALARGIRRREVGWALAVAIGLVRGAPAEPPFASGPQRVVGTVEGPLQRGGSALATEDGTVWVWWPSGADEVAPKPGERVAVTGGVRVPTGPRGPGLPDRRAMLAARGAVAEVVAREVERLADEPGLRARAWRWAARMQAAWSRAIHDACDGCTGAAPLRGIATGDRGDVPEELDRRWRAAGIYHVLSVSGLHLAVVAGLAYALLRRLAAASPWGGRIRPARWAAPPAFAIAVAYTLVTGAEIATVRALLAVAAVFAAAVLDRPVRLIDAVGAAAIVVLAWRPADLFDPAFQLSFTAALVLALRPPSTLPLGATRRDRLAAWLGRGVATSAWIALATAPITAHYFQQVTPGGIAGNLVLTPPVELLALPLALAGVVLGWDAPIWLAAHLVGLVDTCAQALAAVAPVGEVAVASAPLVAVLVALSLWLAARPHRTRADAAAWLGLCLAWSLGTTPPAPGALRVTFVDVGQGDAAIVELPGGGVWLVDAGGSAAAPDLAGASAPGRTIRRVLAAYGRDRIDVAVVSHPHPDHYLGLFAVGVPVGELWAIAGDAPDHGRTALPTFAATAATLVARGTRFAAPALGAHDLGDGVELVVWAPRLGDPPAAAVDPVRTVNDNSIVVELRYRGRAILFAGDVEAEGEEALVAAGVARVDVVKVAHHGSPTSSTAAFVDATRPAAAVISCGRDNRFRFPAPAVVARWRAAGARVLRTDLDASVTVTIDAAGVLAIE